MDAEVPSTGWAPLRHAGGALGRAALPRTAKEEAFYRLALTHALVSAADAMVAVSLAGSIFFTTSLTQARPRLVLSLLLTMAPFAVVAPFLGPAIDRSKGGRRLMIVASAVGRSAVCIYMATVVHSLLLYPCALAVLILSKAHTVAKTALVPATVDNPAEYVRAGGRLAVVATVAGLAGGLPAAMVWKLTDAAWALRLAAVVYACGAVMAVRTRPAPPATLDEPDHVDEAIRSRGVSLAATCMLTMRACSGFLTFAVAFILRREHASALWYGLVGGAALIGGFLGNFVGPRLRQLVREERILTLAMVAVALVGLVAARLDNRLGLVVMGFTMGLASGIAQLSFDAIVQRDGSEGSRGRSFARFEASFQLAWVGAALLPVILPIKTWEACLMMALGAAGVAITYVLGRRAPVPAAAIVGQPVPVLAEDRQAVNWADEEPGVWSAVRPWVDRGVGAWGPSVDHPTPPAGTAALGADPGRAGAAQEGWTPGPAAGAPDASETPEPSAAAAGESGEAGGGR